MSEKENFGDTFNALSVSSYTEEFIDITYKDPATNAWGWGTGTVTNTRDFTWTPLDFYATPNPVRDIVIQGRQLFAGCYNKTDDMDTILAFDINDNSNIRHIGTRDSTIGIISLEVNGDVLYAGIGYPSTLRVNTYNVSNPFILNSGGIYLASSYPDGQVTDMDSNGRLLYHTSYGDAAYRSFRITDATDPANLILLTPNWNNNKSLGLEVVEHYAYIAASNDGFYILNASDKGNPIELGHIALPGNATDVIVDGRFAYLVAGEAGLFVIDVFNPINPEVVGQYNTQGYACELVLQGNTLFVADGPNGVVVLDVADPSHPSFVTQRSLPHTYDVDLYAGILYVGSIEGIHSFKICAGNGLTLFSDGVYPNAFNGYEARDVKVIGDIAYVVGGYDGFYTLNVHNPSNPILLDHITMIGNARKLDVKGQFAYVFGYTSFYIFDVRDPTDIKTVYEYLGMNWCIDPFVHGDILYYTWSLGGFGSFNISQPSSFSIPADMFPDTMYGSNNTAIWAQGPHVFSVENGFSGGIYAHDTRDPYNNKLTDSYTGIPGFFYDIVVDGDIAYTMENQWIVLFNVSDPYNIFVTNSNNNFVGGRLGLTTFGPYIFTAETYNDVHIFNSTNISVLSHLAVVLGLGGATQITTNGDYTYVANRSSLAILRHFESAGDTYVPGAVLAQSKEVDGINGLIKSATLNAELYVTQGSDINFWMSADGGSHWEPALLGDVHTFAYPGDDLRWKAEITGPSDRSVHLYKLTIDFEYNAQPTASTLTDPGSTNFAGVAKLTWTASIDDGAVVYIVQMSDSPAFTPLLKNVTTTATAKNFGFLSKGTYYFRVQAVDDEGLKSAWSNAEDLEVTFGLLSARWLGIFGGLLVLIVLIVVISIVLIRKRKKGTPVR